MPFRVFFTPRAPRARKPVKARDIAGGKGIGDVIQGPEPFDCPHAVNDTRLAVPATIWSPNENVPSNIGSKIALAVVNGPYWVPNELKLTSKGNPGDVSFLICSS